MSTQIKTRRGTAAEHTTFTGAEGELTVNTTNDSVHVHDGSTAGGHELARADGSNLAMESNLTFGDNDKAIFGAGSDLQIYHDGSNSYIQDTGTGRLRLKAYDAVQIQGSNDENLAIFKENAEVQLFHDNSLKLATTSTGIDVTGTATMDGLTVDTSTGEEAIAVKASSTSARYYTLGVDSAADFVIKDAFAGVKHFSLDGGTGDISFYEDTGTTAKFFWDASAERLGIGTSSPSATLELKPSALNVNQLELSSTGNSTADYTYSSSGAYMSYYQRQDGSTYNRHLDITNVGDSSWGGVIKFLSNPNGSINAVERMRIDSSGNVGVGTSSPSAKLHLQNSSENADLALFRSGINTARGLDISLTSNSSVNDAYVVYDATLATYGGHIWQQAGVEKARIDSSGNLLVGGTSVGASASTTIYSTGYIQSRVPNAHAMAADRLSSDGDIVQFRKDGTTVGSIGTDSNSELYISGANNRGGLGFYDSATGAAIQPVNSDGTASNGDTSLGIDTNRFKDLYLSGNVKLVAPNTTNGVTITFGDSADDNIGQIAYENSADFMSFRTNTSEAMRIDSSGNLLVGAASYPIGSTGFKIAGNGFARVERSGTTSQYHMSFTNGNGDVGGISTSGSATTYNTSSDYRLKEDWQPVANASDRVAQLKPVNFAWKADGTRVDGFLAHELAEVIPEAVTGEKDAMRTEEYEVSPAVLDDEGNVVTEAVMGTREVPDYQGIDQSKLVPLLTAALQEALTRIETLEAEVTALKGA